MIDSTLLIILGVIGLFLVIRLIEFLIMSKIRGEKVNFFNPLNPKYNWKGKKK